MFINIGKIFNKIRFLGKPGEERLYLAVTAIDTSTDLDLYWYYLLRGIQFLLFIGGNDFSKI